jgi:DNA segregation ATPase FtsK/SpoIIIE, S-DNA-T family
LERLSRQGGGLALMGCSAALAVALGSYSSADLSLNTATGTDPQNWLGAYGSYVADLLRQAVGGAAFVLPVVLGSWGWRLVSGMGLDRLRLRVSLMAGAAATLAISLAQIPVWPAFSTGGAFGVLVLNAIRGVLPYGGLGVVVALPAALAGVLLTFFACGLPLEDWGRLVAWVGRLMHRLWRGLLGVFGLLRRDPPGLYEIADRDLEAEEEDAPEAFEDDDADGYEEEDDEPVPPRRKAAKSAPRRRSEAPRTARQARLALDEASRELPPLSLLQTPDGSGKAMQISEDTLRRNAQSLQTVLGDFGVTGEIVRANPGPVVTLYELEPAPGTKTSRVIGLSDDIARSMSAVSVRVAVVPGRNVIGVEMPNAKRATVYLRDLLDDPVLDKMGAKLALALGQDIGGEPVFADLARMPHLLVAGTTGSGKSVAVNAMILSLLYRLTPQQCRFIMIDPKMLELSVYEGIPHLLAPVVTEPRKAVMALKWTVREMEDRYRCMSKLGVRNIEGYNLRLREARDKGETLLRKVQTGFDPDTGKPIFEDQPLDLTELPYIVVIVDEMADLMLVAGKDIESAIQRLAQMARAAGIHLIMATQRPSVDVITGTIKANFPTRISFQVTSKIDSRTILGEQGAEQLLGQGDMLYMAGGGRITRVHGPFVRDEEVESVVAFLKQQGEPTYLDAVTEEDDGDGDDGEDGGSGGGRGSSGDALYDQAVDLVCRERKASTSFIQRHLRIGYNSAARLIEQMEKDGVVGAANHVGKREVLVRDPNED